MKQHLEILNDMITFRRDEHNRCITAHTAIRAMSDTANTLNSIREAYSVAQCQFKLNDLPFPVQAYTSVSE